jgi:hypothetical protein
MVSVFSTVRAFFLGFAMLSRDSAVETLQQYRTRIIALLLTALYYTVMGYYFVYHGKQAPREGVSDYMTALFQVVLAWVFYKGFYSLVLFFSREDVQAAFSRAVDGTRVFLLAVWARTKAFIRAVGRFLRVTGRITGRFIAACYRVTVRVGGAVGRQTWKMLTKCANVIGAVALVSFATMVEGGKVSTRKAKIYLRDIKRFASSCVEAGQSARM